MELNKLSSNIRWAWKSNIDSENVVEELKKHHVFLFSILGENCGNVIQEALSAGCPVVISDQIPWKDLEANEAGYVYPISNSIKFENSINKYANNNSEEFDILISKTLLYALENSNDNVTNTGYRNIFNIKE